MRAVRLAIASVVLLSVSVAAAQGGVVLYDNLASVGNSSSLATYDGPLADSFSTGSSDVTLKTVELSLSMNSVGVAGSGFRVDLLADSSSTPGSALATLFTSKDSDVSNPSDLVINTTYSLTANTRYWIAIYNNLKLSSVRWNLATNSTGTGVTGEYNVVAGGTANFGTPKSNSDSYPYAMKVTADLETTPPPAPSVPEPDTIALATLGAFVGFFAPRRRA